MAPEPRPPAPHAGKPAASILSALEPMKEPVSASLADFLALSRDAFAFLTQYGFAEAQPPNHRRDPFKLWFEADDRVVLLQGEGHGDTASVTFETADGREASLVYFVPPSARMASRPQAGQLGEIRRLAILVKEHAADFLAGDIGRYNCIAHKQPEWKRPP